MDILILTILGSIIGFFFNALYALEALILSIIGIQLAMMMGKEFNYKTLGEMTERMTQINYTKSRREYGTMNKNEVVNKIEKLFIMELCLGVEHIDRDVIIV